MAQSNPETTEQPEKLNYFQKLWAYRKYLVVEPFFFFYVMASIFNAVAIQSFPLDKACRVNFGYNKIICDTTLDKGEIECEQYNFENTTVGVTPDLANLTTSSTLFNYTVCKAESESQKLAAEVSGNRAPVAAIFPLIVLLFAGGWADRYNKRKPCMIMPIVGEMLSFVCLLISAIFFDALPMEFGAYLEAIVPALFGGLTLSLMAIYSYMTISTPEEDRIFRFGIFAMFVTAIPFIGQPISGLIFQKLGYPLSFAMALVFQLIAILYIIFFIDEVKPTDTKHPTGDKSTIDVAPPLPAHVPPQLNGTENLGYETTQLDEIHLNKNVSFEMNSRTTESVHHEPPKSDVAPPKQSIWREIFDPSLVYDCLRFPLIKRENNERMLLNLLIMAYFLTVGPVSGENDYWYRYTLVKLNWNGTDFSIYSTVTSGLAMLGTFIGTALLSKILKFSDSTVGMLSAISIVCSRIVYAFAKTTETFYIAGVVDMLVSLRVIAIKTIGSSIVAGEELSKMYAVFGISEPIGQFIFPYLFSVVYRSTVDSFPGAIFLFGEIFYVPNVFVFILCYFLLRRSKNKSKKNAIENGQNGSTVANPGSPDVEVTSL